MGIFDFLFGQKKSANLDPTDVLKRDHNKGNGKSFLMTIEDVFTITGRGTVATGRIETGVANTGDSVDIIGTGGKKLTSTITGVEMFRKILNRGEAGDNVGILLSGIEKGEIKSGMVICTPKKLNKDRSRHISQSVKNQVWNRDNGKCIQCESNSDLEFDHIIPWSKGGANTYRNIQLLCQKCNREKYDKL